VTLPDDRDARLRCYRNALCNWNVRGYVLFTKRVEIWLRQEMEEFTAEEIRHFLHKFVESGGEIDEQVERRPEYTHWRFHYDLRLQIGIRRLYFETVLTCKDPEAVLDTARFIAATRPEYDLSKLERGRFGDRVSVIQIPALAISSTDIRRRVQEGRPIQYLVPPEVAEYIDERRLYRGAEGVDGQNGAGGPSGAGGPRGAGGSGGAGGEAGNGQ